jgi:hypothetical protein
MAYIRKEDTDRPIVKTGEVDINAKLFGFVLM